MWLGESNNMCGMFLKIFKSPLSSLPSHPWCQYHTIQIANQNHPPHLQGITTKDTTPLLECESPPQPLPNQPMPNPQWKSTLPSATNLWRGPFRKQDISHSFTQEESLDTIPSFTILLGFLKDHDLNNLTTAHPPPRQLQQAIIKLHPLQLLLDQNG